MITSNEDEVTAAMYSDPADDDDDDAGGAPGPQCQPISLAFSPVLNIAAATSSTDKRLADQTLNGLVSIAAPQSVNCLFSITSTIPAIVLPQAQVVIPAGFTTAPVYAVFRGSLGVPTPSVFVYARCLDNPSAPLASARIVIPVGVNSVQSDTNLKGNPP